MSLGNKNTFSIRRIRVQHKAPILPWIDLSKGCLSRWGPRKSERPSFNGNSELQRLKHHTIFSWSMLNFVKNNCLDLIFEFLE